MTIRLFKPLILKKRAVSIFRQDHRESGWGRVYRRKGVKVAVEVTSLAKSHTLRAFMGAGGTRILRNCPKLYYLAIQV
jgi:hypothetical protein